MICSLCPEAVPEIVKTFTGSRIFRDHLRTHGAHLKSPSDGHGDDADVRDKNSFCNICGKTFLHMRDYYDHKFPCNLPRAQQETTGEVTPTSAVSMYSVSGIYREARSESSPEVQNDQSTPTQTMAIDNQDPQWLNCYDYHDLVTTGVMNTEANGSEHNWIHNPFSVGYFDSVSYDQTPADIVWPKNQFQICLWPDMNIDNQMDGLPVYASHHTEPLPENCGLSVWPQTSPTKNLYPESSLRLVQASPVPFTALKHDDDHSTKDDSEQYSNATLSHQLFKCGICQKGFSRADDCVQHRDSHPERSFTCKGNLKGGGEWGCGLAFKERYLLKSHFKSEECKPPDEQLDCSPGPETVESVIGSHKLEFGADGYIVDIPLELELEVNAFDWLRQTTEILAIDVKLLGGVTSPTSISQWDEEIPSSGVSSIGVDSQCVVSGIASSLEPTEDHSASTSASSSAVKLTSVRVHPLYQKAEDYKDEEGYHCPWESECGHRPKTYKCDYE